MDKVEEKVMLLDIGTLAIELKIRHGLEWDEVYSALYPKICKYHGIII